VLRPVLSPSLTAVTGESPFAGPAWLAAEAGADPALKPVPVEVDGGWLAAYRLVAPLRADLDPATYLDAACCVDGAACDPAPVGDHLPVLVLGSPAGHLTEVSGPAVEAVVDTAVGRAMATGCRAVLAPWCVDRGSGAQLKATLDARGALVQRRSQAHAIDLRDRSAAAFVAGLPRPVQARREREWSATRAAGYRLARLTPDEWARHRPAATRLATELDAGGALAPDRAGPWPLLDRLEADTLVVWAAFRDDELCACAVFLADGDAWWLALRALAREPRGFPTGLHFSLLLHEVVEAAGLEGVARVEYGVSSSSAWVLRGCDATPVYSCLLPIDAEV
jgi:hypothetical protein